MFVRWMRIAFVGTLVGLSVLIGIGGVARAAQSPPGCTSNDFVLDLAKDKSIVHVGDVITYTVSTGNPNTSGSGCDVDLSTISLTTPDGTVHVLNLGPGAGNSGSYPIGTPVTTAATVTYTASAADQKAGVLDASATATGVLHDSPVVEDPLGITKSVSTSLAIPCITVTKTCTDAPAPGQPIQFSGTVTNCGTAAPQDNLFNVTVVDSQAGTVLTLASLAAGASAPYSGSYVPSGTPSTDTVTATGTDELGLAVTNTASATCRILTSPAIAVTKTCTDAPAPGQPITFAGTVTNTGNVTLSNVACTDDKAGPVSLSTTTLAPGTSVAYSGSYVPSGSPSTDTVTCTGTDAINGGTVSSSASATCNVPTVTEICRTAGFWKTHAGTEKNNSQNITQMVINFSGCLNICGEVITNTLTNSANSALEAMCVAVAGDQRLQLARQLTAAALNCIMTAGDPSCAGVSIGDVFAACNAACASGQVSAVVGGQSIDCTDALDSFNSNPACEAQPLCNKSLNLCFDPPGPAGSTDACNLASSNACTILQPGEAQCGSGCRSTQPESCGKACPVP